MARLSAATPSAPSPFDDGVRIAVAVSGGADSLGLLLLADARFPGRIVAGTFDHGLRRESAAEAARVATICRLLDVPHATLEPDGAGIGGSLERSPGGLQAMARRWRYRGLLQWCVDRDAAWLLTAHHADDQAETVLMRLARGAGSRGLSGIRPTLTAAQALGTIADEPGPSARQIVIGRPLLRFTKAELASIVSAAGLVPIHDPSNADPRFDRTRARALLASADWLDPLRVAAAADVMRDTEEALAWATDEAWRRHVVRHDALHVVDPAGLPPAILWRLCERVVQGCESHDAAGNAAAVRGEDVTAMIARLRRGQAATIGHVMAKPGERWLFRPAPPRRAVPPAPSVAPPARSVDRAP